MEDFRIRNCRLLSRILFNQKLEKIIYNKAVEIVSKTTMTPKREEFVVVYNWLTQIVIEWKDFVIESINTNAVKPCMMMDVLLSRCKRSDYYLCSVALENDGRLPIRFHVARLLRKELGDALGMTVEKSIAEHNLTTKKYKKRSLMIMSNIADARTKLKQRLMDGTFDTEIGISTHQNLWPELWANAEMQPGHRVIISQPEAIHDSLIQCSNCKKNTVETREFQTRSADEPMTIFCNCVTCGKRWKM